MTFPISNLPNQPIPPTIPPPPKNASKKTLYAIIYLPLSSPPSRASLRASQRLLHIRAAIHKPHPYSHCEAHRKVAAAAIHKPHPYSHCEAHRKVAAAAIHKPVTSVTQPPPYYQKIATSLKLLAMTNKIPPPSTRRLPFSLANHPEI